MKKLFFGLCLFFLFNTLEIDSNSEKNLLYDKSDLHLENNYKVYFKNIRSNELESILKVLNIDVLSYIVDGEKYYAKDIDELVNKYIENKSLQEKIYFENNGIKVEGINIICEVNELLKLENLTDIY